MAFSDRDRGFMQRALVLAEKGRGHVEPNPLVGAVIVRDDDVIAEGHYERFGGPHAEVTALREAGGSAAGATLYVTLEPCDHEGKTPACAPMVAESGVSRVVIATTDPTAAAPGGGVAILQRAGIRVDAGLCTGEAVRLNAGFFKLAATGRPAVAAKWAMSADGKIATASGDSRWISDAESRRLVHELRGRVDCIIVGSRTALQDDPLLTCRDAEQRRTAARLVVCGTSLPAADSQLARTACESPVLLAYPAEDPPDGLSQLVGMGCEALPVPGAGEAPHRLDLAALMDLLGARRMTNVLVEGGGELLGNLIDAGLVDRVIAFVAPVIIGNSTAASPVGGQGAAIMADALRLHDAEVGTCGPDACIRGWVTDPLTWAP